MNPTRPTPQTSDDPRPRLSVVLPLLCVCFCVIGFLIRDSLERPALLVAPGGENRESSASLANGERLEPQRRTAASRRLYTGRLSASAPVAPDNTVSAEE